jgi:hypothetical protein
LRGCPRTLAPCGRSDLAASSSQTVLARQSRTRLATLAGSFRVGVIGLGEFGAWGKFDGVCGLAWLGERSAKFGQLCAATKRASTRRERTVDPSGNGLARLAHERSHGVSGAPRGIGERYSIVTVDRSRATNAPSQLERAWSSRRNMNESS